MLSLLGSIDKEIGNAIREQFNIANMDFGKRNVKNNIFNKNIFNPKEIYINILKGENVHDYDIDFMNYTDPAIIKVKHLDELQIVVNFYNDNNYITSSLNWLDVSGITDMQLLFNCTKFNGDISLWDVSNVDSMFSTFMHSEFNGDISKWDVSNVTTMNQMFAFSKFNGDISKWDVSNVTIMQTMFMNSEFNGDISNWDVSSVNNMAYMFKNSKFNGDISKWNVSNVYVMNEMFCDSQFNQNISNWKLFVILRTNMFKNCPIKNKYKPIL